MKKNTLIFSLHSGPRALRALGGILARKTLDSLSRYFTLKSHRPSPAMWAALTDLTLTLEAMAEGQAERVNFLSSLDPGVGKTQTVTHFVDTLLSLPAYVDVGVLICVGRLTEVRSMVVDMAVPPEMLYVLTSDPELNSLGTAPSANDAQVLITTQQMIESRVGDGRYACARTFSEAKLFHYHRQPRQVRIWDESYLPGQTITLSRDDLGFLFKPLRYSFPALTDQLEDLFMRLRDVPDGAVFQLPDFAGTNDVDLNSVIALFESAKDNADGRLKDDQRMDVSSLWYLSGKHVTVRRDYYRGRGTGAYNTVIDYKDTLPEDLAPMVVLDASGRVRDTYRDLEESRGTLVRLTSATKNYSKLTINVWRTGGGKQSFQRHGEELAKGIADTINTKPDEQWLVVCHRPDAKVGDVEKQVRAQAVIPEANLHFTTWGKHMATNEYVDVPNVVLAGTLFYRPSYYEALKRLAAGRSALDGKVTKEEVGRVVAGENAHLILQALCRGAVRRCDGEHCHPCSAYIIAAVKSGIPSQLPSIFPGCKIERWQPVERKLSGHVKRAVELVEEWLASGKASKPLRFTDVAKSLGVTRQDFKNDVRSHNDFIEAIAELGVVETGAGRYFTAFAVAP